MRIASVASCLALACLASSPLDAQNVRESLWFSAGGGYGTAATDCEDCTGQRQSGTGFFLRFGGASSPRASLGVEAAIWNHDDEGSKIGISSLFGILQAYPSTVGGLFFGFGLGVSRSHLEFPSIDYVRTAVAVQFGAGYDIAIDRHFAFTPSAFWVKSLGSAGRTQFNGARIDEEVNPDYFQFSLGLSWH